uniref:DUF4278 domain-containing protein n=1 Tax=Cyanothece sp. (strain PCC 7425 / ATCC 29141) TaxID=395961 RepID=B8HZP0_CYAP4
MKLSYRGIQYDYHPRPGTTGKPAPAAQAQPYTLTYRGTSYQINPRVPKPPAVNFPNGYELIYRGNRYSVPSTQTLQPAAVLAHSL